VSVHISLAIPDLTEKGSTQVFERGLASCASFDLKAPIEFWQRGFLHRQQVVGKKGRRG
jgi:hypothetical protein